MQIFGIYIPDEYVVYVYIFHILISIFITFFISIYLSKRYVSDTQYAQNSDKKRLEELDGRSYLFRTLFKISLHKNNPIATRVFFLLFNISVPLIGYVASFWIAYYLVNVKYEKKVISTSFINLDEFSKSFLKVERIFGEGSMLNLLLNDDVPKSKKLKALSSLSAQVTPVSLKIIKQTLSSNDDEIRMYGYAVINKIEMKLNNDINNYLNIYTKSDDNDDKKYEAAKDLAFAYWEMIYSGISHESLRDNFFEEVIKYLNIAKKHYLSKLDNLEHEIIKYEENLEEIYVEEDERETLDKNELEKIENLKHDIKVEKNRIREYKDIISKLYVLMGRVYMMKEEYHNAITEFTVAQELNEHDSAFILPYIAEIYFIMKKFDIVKSILENASSLELNSKLYPIIRQWRHR